MPHMGQDAPTIVVDWTEHAAVMTLLKAVIASTAAQQEMLGVGGGQAWINAISEACQVAIHGGHIAANLPGVDVEAFRRKTMENINSILAGLAPETGASKSHN